MIVCQESKHVGMEMELIKPLLYHTLSYRTGAEIFILHHNSNNRDRFISCFTTNNSIPATLISPASFHTIEKLRLVDKIYM